MHQVGAPPASPRGCPVSIPASEARNLPESEALVETPQRLSSGCLIRWSRCSAMCVRTHQRGSGNGLHSRRDSSGRRAWAVRLAKTHLKMVQGREVPRSVCCSAGNNSLPISTFRNCSALSLLCQVEPVLALPTDWTSKISTTPKIRLCTRMKRAMCDDSGIQDLIARAAIEATSMPTPAHQTNR